MAYIYKKGQRIKGPEGSGYLVLRDIEFVPNGDAKRHIFDYELNPADFEAFGGAPDLREINEGTITCAPQWWFRPEGGNPMHAAHRRWLKEKEYAKIGRTAYFAKRRAEEAELRAFHSERRKNGGWARDLAHLINDKLGDGYYVSVRSYNQESVSLEVRRDLGEDAFPPSTRYHPANRHLAPVFEVGYPSRGYYFKDEVASATAKIYAGLALQ